MARVPAQAESGEGRTRRRPPIHVSFGEKVYRLGLAAGYVRHAMDDDRWNAYREILFEGNGADLKRTIDRLTEVYESLQSASTREENREGV